MESCKLEIIIHSGKALNNIKNFGTMDPYVVVWIAGDGKQSKPRKTTIATKGASCPVWDCSMKFNVSSMHSNYTLFCQIMHGGKMFDRNIGHAQISFKDLLAGAASGENISYPVTTSSGEIKGEIILSHKFSHPGAGSAEKDVTGKVTGSPKNKVQKKKKNRMMKRFAKNVVAKVATEAIVLAGTVGLVFAVESMDAGNDPSAEVETENINENENEDDLENEDEYEDEEEDDIDI